MTQDQLRLIFQSNYSQCNWYDLLRFIFEGSQKPCQLRLLENPVQIPVPDEERMDGFSIGNVAFGTEKLQLYVFKLKDNTQISRNRVGLRNTVNYLAQTDDAALVVYYNDEEWRVSYICDIIGKTALKRFSFAFGSDQERYTTPVRRFGDLANKDLTFKAIYEAFSVEALNTDFYKFIAGRFYELVGATTGQGKNKAVHERTMRLPGEQNNLVYQEFAVRLIGRTVFCWFLKEKKSGDGKPLLPVELLSSKSLETHSDYYHTVLERIFFQTLNTPPEERVANLPKGCELIPFLNGGLFDPKRFDFFGPEHRDEVHIPDEWFAALFAALFAELEQYNFTIDENSPDDIEVSVDPEMLGRIFENLLAEIDPDSGETARKATGSFYTPREIVDYMAVESLVYYLNRKTGIDKETIYPLFKPVDAPDYTAAQREKLLVALDELKILDPACGSGAFPMGVLAKITGALKILDGDGSWWKERQVRRIDNAAVRHQMQEKLDAATVEYARKIGIIQNTLYGVDIQPIAAEISKLRCFLTLIVDENVNDSKPNRGVDPLPNLEFKFITADSLLKLPPVSDFGGLFGRDTTYELTEKLRQLRIDYLQSYGQEKLRIKEEYLATQLELSSLNTYGVAAENSCECLIGSWNPFSNEKSDWFDPEWMFGVKDGFDIVIANPPYVSVKDINKDKLNSYKQFYKTAKGQTDLYALFMELAIERSSSKGIIAYIVPDTLNDRSNFTETRKILLEQTSLSTVLTLNSVFENANVGSTIFIALKGPNATPVKFSRTENPETFKQDALTTILIGQTSLYSNDRHCFLFMNQQKIELLNKIDGGKQRLEEICYLGRGEEIGKKADVISTMATESTKPFFSGGDFSKYTIPTITKWIESDDIRKSQDTLYGVKIVVRQVGSDITATYDYRGCVIPQSVYAIVCRVETYAMEYLLALLNSSLFNFIYLNKYKTKEIFPRILLENLKSLPVAFAQKQAQRPFVDLVDQILAVKSADSAADTSALESEIDRMVYDLYGLTPEEVKIIEK